MRVCGEDGCPEQSPKPYCPRHTRSRRSPSSRVTGTHRWKVLKRDLLRHRPRCHYCGTARATTLDHVVPVSRGGAKFDEANLVPVCKPCNDRKGGRASLS